MFVVVRDSVTSHWVYHIRMALGVRMRQEVSWSTVVCLAPDLAALRLCLVYTCLGHTPVTVLLFAPVLARLSVFDIIGIVGLQLTN